MPYPAGFYGAIARVDVNGAEEMFDSPQVLPISREARDELQGPSLPDVRITRTIEEDRATSDVHASFEERIPKSSLLIMRLILDGRRLGALVLRADGEGRYTQGHAELMKQLNEPFAIAINNAIAHHELHRLSLLLSDDNRYLNAELQRMSGEQIIGAEFGLSAVMNMVQSVAGHELPASRGLSQTRNSPPW